MIPAAGGVAQVGTVTRAPKTAELIAANLRRQIVQGQLRPGETLPPEVHLMEQFGVSRPTLREAFRILETESLIGVRRGSRGGAQVLDPDPRVAARHVGLLLQLRGTTIHDVYEARTLTEPLCARLLAERRTERDVVDLRDRVASIGAELSLPGGTDPLVASRSTYSFHELLLQRCGNKTLGVQGAVLADIVHTHLSQVLTRLDRTAETAHGLRRTLRSFERLVDLVEGGDADAAESHWQAHMRNTAKYVFDTDPRDHPVVDLFS
jgi:DNA-binding FadR family transcriptional regulator